MIAPGQLAETPLLADVREEGDLDRFGEPTIRTLWNLAGAPVVCLPAGRTPAGMPVGVQIAGPHHRDRALLRLAETYEEAHAPLKWVPETCRGNPRSA